MIATYRYSFDGVKREAKVTSGASSAPAGQPIAYAYLGSLVYTKTDDSYQLESTDFSGGRIVPDDTQHPVHYHTTDHLGSVRVVAWPEEGDDAAVILEQNDYYPYGLRMDNGLTASTDNRYRFSGKEAQPLMDGSILDFGTRYYNPTIARWTTIDPTAEKYYSTTPYSYCAGNPVMYVDTDGRKIKIGTPVGRFKAFLGVKNFEYKVTRDLKTLRLKDPTLSQAISHVEKSYITINIVDAGKYCQIIIRLSNQR